MLSRRTMMRNRLRGAYFRIEHEQDGLAADGDTLAGERSRASVSNGSTATTACPPEARRSVTHVSDLHQKAS